MASAGNLTVNIHPNTEPVIEAMVAIGGAWLEAGEYMTQAAEAMLRGAQLLREQQTEESDDTWGETN